MPCDDPVTVVLKDVYRLPDGSYSKTVAVPCNKCAVCRKNKVDEWSFRLRQEKKISASSYFVTLTYAKVPRSNNNLPTLFPSDLTKYLKRVRKWMKDDGIDMPALRYYAIGEYGTNFQRPHYHLIVMNATSDHLIEAWCVIDRGTTRKDATVPIGNVHIGTVTSDSIAYCVKYLDKGRIVPAHSRDDRVKEFSRMSRNLGANYLTPEMVKWHRNDVNRNYCQDGVYKIPLPKYYRDRIYDAVQMAAQREVIFSSIESRENKEMKQYFLDYPNKSVSDFYKDKQNQKVARNDKFVKNGKKRKI